MAYAQVLSGIPATLTAGDSVSWLRTESDYPADVWTLTYSLIKTDTQIQIVASASGTDHLVEVAATTTADYTAGAYDWQAHVTDGTERYLLDSGIVTVVTDYAGEGTGFDARSHSKIVLDALEAAIEGRATKTQLSQKVGEVQVTHMSLSDLIKARDVYSAKYRKELVTAGKAKSHHIIKARFV